jgi:UDP-N-acetylmuramoyl-tripeptide--D-alanyl-D-alanine ligase
MIPMTLAEVAAVIGADAPAGAADMTVTGVEFDSRKVTPGALFVALAGEHVDGHDFAAAAARAGAVAVLGSRPVPELPTLVAPAVPAARPASAAPADQLDPRSAAVLAALSALARHVCRRLVADGLTVVAVTGSVGKTSTKDLIAAVLSRAGTVVAPPESFNNEIGHPYTVLRADADTDFLVLELSARGLGHIAALAEIAPPRIGAVLNVGSAHLGEFGSRDAIAQAKGELVEALPSAADGGVAILNADDDRVAAMASRTAAAVVRTSVASPATVPAAVYATDIHLDSSARASFRLVTPEGAAPVTLAVVGEHQVPNAVAAAAVGRAVGIGVSAIADALSAAGPVSKWRMAVTHLPGGITVVNDAYNANPESVRAALHALVQIEASGVRWAVLGGMAELGAAAAEEHLRIGAEAQRGGVQVLAVGDAARPIFDGADRVFEQAGGLRPLWVSGIDTAVALLAGMVQPADVVLVKASRAVGFERLAARLIDALSSAPAAHRSVWNGEGRA